VVEIRTCDYGESLALGLLVLVAHGHDIAAGEWFPFRYASANPVRCRQHLPVMPRALVPLGTAHTRQEWMDKAFLS
jgi:hypothetical protein